MQREGRVGSVRDQKEGSETPFFLNQVNCQPDLFFTSSLVFNKHSYPIRLVNLTLYSMRERDDGVNVLKIVPVTESVEAPVQSLIVGPRSNYGRTGGT